MYQVLTLYGENEPWWFFEGWQDEIRGLKQFETLEEAKEEYAKQWLELREKYEHVHVKPNFLTAFWNDGEEYWCEECVEGLQLYLGLALLQEYHPVTIEVDRTFYQNILNDKEKAKICQRK